MLTFRQIQVNYPHWDRPADKDQAGWTALLQIWQMNLEGMDDDMLGMALQHHIRHGHQWEKSSYPPTPGKLWVAWDKKCTEDEERLQRSRTMGQGTAIRYPDAEKRSVRTGTGQDWQDWLAEFTRQSAEYARQRQAFTDAIRIHFGLRWDRGDDREVLYYIIGLWQESDPKLTTEQCVEEAGKWLQDHPRKNQRKRRYQRPQVVNVEVEEAVPF
uniref:Replication protein n=1 Tax=viral metagenome TaxID=1070528 RepID=A0A6M3L5P5_9ZZZZ